MRLGKTTGAALACGIAFSALTAQAYALDANAFVDRLEAVYHTVGYDFDLGDAVLDGDTITVSGGTLSIVSPEFDMDLIEFDNEITFSGVEEREDGSYFASSVEIPDIAEDFDMEGNGSFSLEDIRVDGFYLPAGDPVRADGVAQLFETFTTGAMSLSHEGNEVLDIASIELTNTFSPEYPTTELADMESVLAMRGIEIDFTPLAAEDPGFADILDKLGMTKLSGEIEQLFTWDTADGGIFMDSEISFMDQGSLRFRVDVSGFTTEVLDQLYSLQADMMAASAGEASQADDQSKLESKAMRVLTNIMLNSVSLRYEDDSLMGRLLDFWAEQDGVERDAFVEQAIMMAKATSSGVPGLSEIVVPALEKFLSDPQSLEVSVVPPTPMNYTDFQVTLQAADPLSEMGFSFEANQAE